MIYDTGMPAETRLERRRRLIAAAMATAADHDGVLSRGQLRQLGLTRDDVRREVRAGRWTLHGRESVAAYSGPLDHRARWRVALAATSKHAALDGVSALLAAGLRNYTVDGIHVSVPRGTRPGRHPGVLVHETRRRRDGDVIVAGIPRVRPATAVVRAALWATSDRQAALLVVMTVQQRLTTPDAISRELRHIRRDRRRRLLNTVLRDVADGAQALGELDFAGLCRLYGVPQPDRQVVRCGPRGRVYLDASWEDCGVVAEIEGVHHGEGGTQVEDALRQNALSIDGSRWLRIPVLGLRIAPAEFMAQVRAARQRANPAA